VRYGAHLLTELRALGLDEVQVEGTVHGVRAIDLAPLLRPILVGLRKQLIETGLITEQEVQQAIDRFDPSAPPLTTFTPMLVSARGRAPHPV
jgi:hypothetical protein